MINIDTTSLNTLEKDIYNKLTDYSKQKDKIRISEAAEYCSCSTSKISKFVRKLGFNNFKQFTDFLYGNDVALESSSSELDRIRMFIDTFDPKLVDDLISLIDDHSKIIFFGYGPSLLCAQYFEYRLRTCTNKVVMATSEELSISSVMDEETLVIILTVTGKFNSFENIYTRAKQKGAEVALIIEEYNAELLEQCDTIFWLSETPQPSDLKAYEKTRTLFFIFLEEVVQKLQNMNVQKE